MSKLRKIHIVWIDSISTQGWERDHKDSDLTCETFGFYVRENKVAVTVALSYAYITGAYADYLEIPKVSIKKRRWVKI